MNQPLASIVIPSFNRSKLIQERALKSALAQTYKNIEIIIVNDGSDQKYSVSGENVRYFKPWLKNRGGSAARNYGLTKAKGKYIVFIDDDNMLDPQFLEKIVPKMETSTDWIKAVTTWRRVDSKLSGVDLVQTSITNFPAIDWGWLIRREVFDKIQYDEVIWGDEDADFGIQFLKAGFHYAVLGEYLQTAYAPSAEEEESSNTFPNERRLQGLANFLSKNLQEYTDSNERRYILRLAGRNYLRAGHYFTGVKYFWQSLMSKKNWETFKHFLFALFGWKVYDFYMSYEERKRV